MLGSSKLVIMAGRGIFVACACVAACMSAFGVAAVELIAGGTGWALQFDGQDDFVNLLVTLPPAPWTIEVWVYPFTLTDGSGAEVVQFNPAGTLFSQTSIDSGGTVLQVLYNGGEVWHPASDQLSIRTSKVNPTAARGVAYHVAVVKNTTETLVFLNGELAGRMALDVAADYVNFHRDGVTPWMMGGRMVLLRGQWVTNDRNFGGIMDEVRWWKVARTPEQLREFMRKPVDEDSGDLVRQWHFDAGRGSGGGSNDGFILGGGNPAKTPVRVPSPFPGHGGPVALATRVGAARQPFQVCALLTPAVPNATAAVAVGSNATTLGDLLIANQSMVPQVDGAPTGSQRFCANASFAPSSPGFQEVPFTVTAVLPSGETLIANQSIAVSVGTNSPPVAGSARAVQTNGVDSYLSLGSWGMSDEWSMSLWLKPHALEDDMTFFSQHLSTGANAFLLYFSARSYRIRIICYRGCSTQATGTSSFPVATGSAPVLSTGLTGDEVRAQIPKPHHVALTFRCLSRGDNGTGPVGHLKMYQNGKLIGNEPNFRSCMTLPTVPDAYHDDDWRNRPTPWELGQEYDGGPLGGHLPGVAVVPSNFVHATFDDFVVWNASLSDADVLAVSQGVLPRTSDLNVHYSFDQDDASECRERQLSDAKVTCFGINEAAGRTHPSKPFPWTNAAIGKVPYVPSPFWQVPGAPIHKALSAGTCVNATLLGTDVDGDPIKFRLVEVPAGESVRHTGNQLQLCDGDSTSKSVREVSVAFDACDPYGLCASNVTGLGRVVFHILPGGPAIVAFQAVREDLALRLVFDVATNCPFVGTLDAVRATLRLSDSTARLLGVYWEVGCRALRLILAEPVTWFKVRPAEVRAELLDGGYVRDASASSYPSRGASPLLTDLACAAGELLFPGELACKPCPAGTSQPRGGAANCRVCEAGTFSSAGRSSCDRCPRATYANDTGRALCTSCPTGKTTDGTGLTSLWDCGCPPSTYPSVAGDACLACGEGMTCKGFGAPAVAAPGYQLAACDDELCVFRCWRDPRRCPGGELSRCATGRTGVACGECEPGKVEVDKGELAGTCQDCEGEDFSALPLALIFTGLILAVYYLGSRRTQAIQTTSAIVLVTTLSQVAVVLQTLSAVSRLTIEWVEPAKSMVRLFSVLALDIEWVRWGCFGGALNVMDRYILRLVVAPCCIAWIILVHVLVSIIMRLTQAWVKKYLVSDASASALQNSIGGFVMVLLVAITSTSLSPFKCQQSPNGRWTMTEYDSQICWDGETHAGLIVLGSVGLLVPSCFFVYIVYIIWVSAAKIASGTVTFLHSHAFLFARVRPQHLWFALLIVLRNLCVATFPAVPDAFWQVFLEQCAIMLYTTAVLQVRPWRLPLNNFLDICFGALFFVILMCASSNLPEGSMDPQEIGTLVVICIITLLVIVAALLVAALLKLAAPRRRRFDCFICHQKQSAGAFARLLNLHLEDALQREVFIDADHLSRLDTLFQHVRNDTGTLVVLLTSRLLHSPWCLGEVTTASKYGVKILPVYLQGFESPSVQWVDTIQEQVDLTVLAENAISASDVREAVKELMMLDHVKSTERVCARMVTGLVEAIADRRMQAGTESLAEKVSLPLKRLHLVTMVSGRFSTSRSRLSMLKDDFVCMAIADGSNPESMSSALILIHMMHKLQQAELRKVVPKLLDFGSDSPDLIMQWAKEERNFALFVCFTHGCFRSAEFMLGLMCSSVLNLVLVLPVVMPDDFHYPTEETYLVLEKDVTSLCANKGAPDASTMVRTFVKSILINIAARLSAQSDKNTLSTQVMNILSRVQTGFGKHKGCKPEAELREGILAAFLQGGRDVLDAHSKMDIDEESKSSDDKSI